MTGARMTLELAADLGELKRLERTAAEFASAQGLPEDVAGAVRLALEEVVTNVIRHGRPGGTGPAIRVDLAVVADEVQVTVEDSGTPFDPLARPEPDVSLPVEERPIGGLGVYLVRTIMDRVQYQSQAGKNILTMWKRRG